MCEIFSSLQEKGWRLGIAESCTGGSLCAKLVSVPGASQYVTGCIVAYTPAAKEKFFGINPGDVDKRGAGPIIAEKMARCVSDILGTEAAIATHGAAGPSPMGDIPTGEVYVAVSLPGGVTSRKLVLEGSREEIMHAASLEALDILHRVLSGQSI